VWHFRLRDLRTDQQDSEAVRDTLPARQASNQGSHGVCPRIDGPEAGEGETRDFDDGPRQESVIVNYEYSCEEISPRLLRDDALEIVASQEQLGSSNLCEPCQIQKAKGWWVWRSGGCTPHLKFDGLAHP
jgi:hypothetical protein